MKKLKLIIILLMFCIVLSGCSATNTVTLSKSGIVTEDVSIMEDNLKLIYCNMYLEE